MPNKRPEEKKIDKQKQLKSLPGVDHLLATAMEDDRFEQIPRTVILDACGKVLTGSEKKSWTANRQIPIKMPFSPPPLTWQNRK